MQDIVVEMNREEWNWLHVTLLWTQTSAEMSHRSAGKAPLRVNCWTVHSGVKLDYQDAVWGTQDM